MPYSNESMEKKTQPKETERENADLFFQWVSLGGANASPPDERGCLSAGSDNDSLFSFICEAHLQEAQEFRRKGYNSQVPVVDPNLVTRLREAVTAFKSRLYLHVNIEDPLGSRWRLEQIEKIERLRGRLSDDRMQHWINHELPCKSSGGDGNNLLGSRRAAQSLVRRLESTLQTLIRVVDTLRTIDAYSTQEKRRDMLVAELTDAFSSIDNNTVIHALERMKAEVVDNAAWSSLMQARAQAWAAVQATNVGAMIKTTRHEAEKANKKARELQGASQAFFSDVAAYLQGLSSDLAKASINVSQSISPRIIQKVNDDGVAAPLSHSNTLVKRLTTGFAKKKLQLHASVAGGKVNAHRLVRILRHGHTTKTPSKESEHVIANSIIRSILWQWQQPAIKIQYASAALLSKVDELQKIEGMLLSYAVANERGNKPEGSDISVNHQGVDDMVTQVRQWVNDSIEQEKSENQQAAKVATLERLLDGDIASARNLVKHLGKTEESILNLLRRQRFAVLKMVTENLFGDALNLSALKEVDNKLLPDMVRDLTASITALDKALLVAEYPTRDFAEAKKQVSYAQLLATKVKESLSADSARLTERPLDEYSRGSRLAKHWANLVKERNLSNCPPLDAEQVFSSLRKQGLLAGIHSTGDPEGYLFATRVAGEIENARNDELRLPMSPEQYTELEKELVEYVVKWGQKSVSRGATRMVIELSFEQALDTVSLNMSSLFRLPYKVLKASIKIPYSVNKVSNYTMPGYDKPYKAIYGLLEKKLKQLGFNLLTAPVPSVVKLAVGTGVNAGAILHNLHVGSRERKIRKVYQRLAEGKKSEKIKMDSLSEMIFDSVDGVATTAAFKGICRAWKSEGSERADIHNKQYVNAHVVAINEDTLSHTHSDKEEIRIPNGVKLILKGGGGFRIAVNEHVEELQKHPSGRAILEGLVGRRIEIRPPLDNDFFRKEDDGRSYYGSRVVGESIFFDPYNKYYGINRDTDVELWRDLDPSIVLFHELLHIYEGDGRHETIVSSNPTRLDENDYRKEFYESRNLSFVERHLSEHEVSDYQYASVSKKTSNLTKREWMLNEIDDALADFEGDNKNKPVSDIKSAIFLDEYLYNKGLSADAYKSKYKKEWFRVRSELNIINNEVVKRYLDFRMIIESYDVYKGKLIKYHIPNSRNEVIDDILNLFCELESNSDPFAIDKAINNFEQDYASHLENEFEDDEEIISENRIDRILKIAPIYYLLNSKGSNNKIEPLYLKVLKSYLFCDDEPDNGTELSNVNIMSIISVLEETQKKHREAYELCMKVDNIIKILSVNGKKNNELFLDARIMAAQIYDGILDASLINDRVEFIKRYSNIKSESKDGAWRLLHIESIIYYLQRNNEESYLKSAENESGILLLALLLANSERELKGILHVNNDEFTSYLNFKTRHELGNDDEEYYSQFDNYLNEQSAEKEAKHQLLSVINSLQLSIGDLFNTVEDVNVLSYVYKNRDGAVTIPAPGRVIIIKLKEIDAGAVVISNVFLSDHVSRISNEEYNKLYPVFKGRESGSLEYRNLKSPYYYSGSQAEHSKLLKMLIGKDEDKIRSNLRKENIWFGHPARFSNEYPDKENVQHLKNKTLLDGILGGKAIQNQAAVSYLRSAMYSLTDWEKIAYRFIPFYEIGHRNQTDKQYEISSEQFILDLISVVTIAYPAVKGITTTIRSSSISSILKSGLKGSALVKSLGNEMGRLGFSASKVFGMAAYELIEPFPINSHFTLDAIIDDAKSARKKTHFPTAWVVNVPILNSVIPNESGIYKVRKESGMTTQGFDFYIKKDNKFYSVKYDVNNHFWRLCPPGKHAKGDFQPSIRLNVKGEWEFHSDNELRGGKLKNLVGRYRNKIVIGKHVFKRVKFDKKKLNEIIRIANTYVSTPNATGRIAKTQREYAIGKETSHSPKYEKYNNLSLDEKFDLFIDSNTDAKTRGVLAEKINTGIMNINLYKTAKAAAFWKNSAKRAKSVVLFPQGIFLKGMAGECLPESVLMGLALQSGQDAKLVEKLMDIYSSPDIAANPLYESLVELHSDGNASRFSTSAISDVEISTLIDAEHKLFPTESSSVRVDIPGHTMLISRVNKLGKVKYVFYDPNYGLAYFDKFKEMNAFFEKKLRDYDTTESSTKFYHLDYTRLTEIKIKGKNLNEIINNDATKIFSEKV